MTRSNDLSAIADFLFEAGQLRRVQRSGWTLTGVTQTESVAEHSHRTAIAGMVLAAMAGIDDTKIVKSALLHDLPEARVGDLHHLAQRYLPADQDRSTRVLNDQLAHIPEPTRRALFQAASRKELSHEEAGLVKDADTIDALMFVLESISDERMLRSNWTEYLYARLLTDEARELARVLMKSDPNHWWTHAVVHGTD